MKEIVFIFFIFILSSLTTSTIVAQNIDCLYGVNELTGTCKTAGETVDYSGDKKNSTTGTAPVSNNGRNRHSGKTTGTAPVSNNGRNGHSGHINTDKVGVSTIKVKKQITGKTIEKYCANKEEKMRDAHTWGKGFVQYDSVCSKYWGGKDGYHAFMDGLNKIISWIFKIALLLGAIALISGGGLYLSSAYNPKRRELAKNILVKTFMGVVLIFISWYVIDFIIDTLSSDKYSGLK